MKFLVLTKQTPDTEAKIVPDGKNIAKADLKYILSPYDDFAVEEAIAQRDKLGSGEVVVASFGPLDAKERMIKALAMGADRGILVSNEGLENCDAMVVAEILAKVVKAESPDIVFTGKQAIQHDNMHVPVFLAEILGWPHVNNVIKCELNGKNLLVEREVDGGQVEVYEAESPILLGAHKSLNNPRFAPLPGIMKAKKKPFDQKTVSDLGLDVADLKKRQTTTIETFRPLKSPPQAKILRGEAPKVMVDKLVDLLKNEAKVL